jgi:hypothetical protein
MRRPVLVVCLVAALALQATLFWIYYAPAPKTLWGDETMYLRVARAMRTDPATRIDPLWPPLYARFVAWLLPAGGSSLLALQIVQILLLVFVAVLARDLWRRLLGSGLYADLFGLGFLLYPPLVAFTHYLWAEVLHLALFASALWILVARRHRTFWMVALGVLLGLCLLTKSLLGPFLPVLLVPLLLEGRARERVLRVAVVAVFLVATVLPTVLDNRQRTGVAMIADSSRLNLWIGLNDVSRRNFVDTIVPRELSAYTSSSPEHRERNAVLSRKIAERLRERGVVAILSDQLRRQYFRLFDKDSFLTDQLPGGAVAALGAGYAGPPAAAVLGLRGSSYALYAVLLVGAAAGMVLCPPRRRLWLWGVLAFLAYNLAIFLFLHVKTRYRVPLLPFLWLYALLALERLVAWRRADPAAEAVPGPGQRVVAALVAAAVLFLAFGGPLLDD